MLILTRKKGESITIGNEITITILKFKGNQVRLGVNAPKNIAIHREEIWQSSNEKSNCLTSSWQEIRSLNDNGEYYGHS